jgi:hypothetical protein
MWATIKMKAVVTSIARLEAWKPDGEPRRLKKSWSLLIPAVESVWTCRQGNVFYVWSVVNHPTPDIRRSIYEQECSIIDQFEEYEFDFDIIPRRDRDTNSVFSDPNIELTFSRAS